MEKIEDLAHELFAKTLFSLDKYRFKIGVGNSVMF